MQIHLNSGAYEKVQNNAGDAVENSPNNFSDKLMRPTDTAQSMNARYGQKFFDSAPERQVGRIDHFCRG